MRIMKILHTITMPLFLTRHGTADVFISYASEDNEHNVLHPLELENWLQSLGYTVWWDRHMQIGDAQKQLARRVKRAQCVMALWSPRADASRNVFYECQHAANANKLLPVIIDGDHTILPPEWRHLHYLELTDFDAQKADIRRKLPAPSGTPAMIFGSDLATMENRDNHKFIALRDKLMELKELTKEGVFIDDGIPIELQKKLTGKYYDK